MTPGCLRGHVLTRTTATLALLASLLAACGETPPPPPDHAARLVEWLHAEIIDPHPRPAPTADGVTRGLLGPYAAHADLFARFDAELRQTLARADAHLAALESLSTPEGMLHRGDTLAAMLVEMRNLRDEFRARVEGYRAEAATLELEVPAQATRSFETAYARAVDEPATLATMALVVSVEALAQLDALSRFLRQNEALLANSDPGEIEDLQLRAQIQDRFREVDAFGKRVGELQATLRKLAQGG